MSGRGRGKRPGSGPGRPPKYPNLNTSPPPEDSEMRASTSNTSTSGGLVEILNQLDGGKRNEMLSLVGQYKGRVIGLNDFMMRSRELLGERLYAQLARDMSQAAAARGAGIPQQQQNPMMNATQMLPPQPPHLLSQQQFMPQNPAAMMMPMMPPFTGNIRPPVASSANSTIPIHHSMPQIYASQSQQQHQQGPVMSNANVEVDVTKMDTSSLQDVMQYSGVDLKAEAELLYREHDFNNPTTASMYVDHRLKFDYFFNPFKFRAIVQHALQRHFFSNTLNVGNNSSTNEPPGKMSKPLGISEEAVHLLGIAIQKRLIGIIRRLSEISKHRVDYSRGRFKIKIENDPKKQLWLQEKLFIEGVGEEKRKATAATASTSSSQNAHASNSSSNQVLLNPPSLSTYTAMAKSSTNVPVTNVTAANSNTTTTTTTTQPATKVEDSVKTKLANVTAMAALGIRQKSWMSSATAINNLPSASSTSTSGSTNVNSGPSNSTASTTIAGDEKDSADSSHPQHPLANFYSLLSSTPLTDAELRAQYYNRTISTVDLIACMESDSHLKRSKLLAVLYEALPRENKENAPLPPPEE